MYALQRQQQVAWSLISKAMAESDVDSKPEAGTPQYLRQNAKTCCKQYLYENCEPDESGEGDYDDEGEDGLGPVVLRPGEAKELV